MRYFIDDAAFAPPSANRVRYSNRFEQNLIMAIVTGVVICAIG